MDRLLTVKEVADKLSLAPGSIYHWLSAGRLRAGLQHARSQGRRLGRPPCRVLTLEEVTNLRKERIRTKAPFRTLAAKYGISVFTAHNLCCAQRKDGGLGTDRPSLTPKVKPTKSML